MAKEPAKTTKITVARAGAGRSQRRQGADPGPGVNRRITACHLARAALRASCRRRAADMRCTPDEARSAMAQVGGTWRWARI